MFDSIMNKLLSYPGIEFMSKFVFISFASNIAFVILYTVKTRIKEPLFYGVRLVKVLKPRHLTEHFAQTLGRGGVL